MKILVVNNFFPPRPGGSSHLADHLAKRYAKAGHEVLVLTASYKDALAEEERDGLRIVRLPAWTLPKTPFAANFDIGFTMSPSVKRTAFRILDDFAPDVIHQHGQFFDLTWLTGWWARSRKVPTLLSIHTRLFSPNWLHNTIYRMADFLVVRPTMRVHRPTLVIMDVLMNSYVDQRYQRVMGAKVNIPVGIEPEKLRGGDAERAREHFDFQDKHVILSVGHVIPQRSRLALVEALPAVLERFPNIVVLVIGGVYHDAFIHRAKELGVDHAIAAIGARPQSEIPDFFAAADLEVHELEGQGFGTASLESLAAGVPVVAAIRPDNFIEVLVEDKKHLFIAPFISDHDERADPGGLAKVLMEVLEDPAAARELVVDNARSLVEENFTIERVAEQHLEVLATMVTDNTH